MDSLFHFDRNLHDVIPEKNHLVFIKSDHMQITLDLNLVNSEEVFGYYVDGYHKESDSWIQVLRPAYPDQHQLAAFMEVNASVCVLRIDKDKKHLYIDEIEEAEGLGIRVVYEPEVTVAEFFKAIEEIAA